MAARAGLGLVEGLAEVHEGYGCHRILPFSLILFQKFLGVFGLSTV